MEWNAATFWVGFGFGPFKRCQREWVLFLVTFDAFRAAQPCWLLSDLSDSLPGTRYDSFCFMFRSTFTKSYRVDRVSEETPQRGQFPIRSGECKVTWQKITGASVVTCLAVPNFTFNEQWTMKVLNDVKTTRGQCFFMSFLWFRFGILMLVISWKTRFYLVSLSTHGLAQAATLEDGCFVDAGTIFIKL